MARKRSVPPVHIPLLDFTKLNQPRQSQHRSSLQQQSKSKAYANQPIKSNLDQKQATLHATLAKNQGLM